MNRTLVMSLMAFMLMVGNPAAPAQTQSSPPTTVHGFIMKNIDGQDVPLEQYKGKVLLLVNVASRCGYTSQYKDLEQLYRSYKEKGFEVLGFPANNFLGQEPGTDEQIKEFCTSTYDVTFDMFSKISVKGSDKHPLYQFLTSEAEHGRLGGEVKWNFTKFLVDREGRVIGRFAPGTKPLSSEVVSSVEGALRGS